MQNASLETTEWQQLRAQLPAGYDLEGRARALGAFKRRRGVPDVDTLLRLALGYGGFGMSLRSNAGWASMIGIAQLSDVALLHRLEKAASRLGELAAPPP